MRSSTLSNRTRNKERLGDKKRGFMDLATFRDNEPKSRERGDNMATFSNNEPGNEIGDKTDNTDEIKVVKVVGDKTNTEIRDKKRTGEEIKSREIKVDDEDMNENNFAPRNKMSSLSRIRDKKKMKIQDTTNKRYSKIQKQNQVSKVGLTLDKPELVQLKAGADPSPSKLKISNGKQMTIRNYFSSKQTQNEF